MFDALIEKLKYEYAKRPANQGLKLEENRESFLKLTLREQLETVNQILSMLRCDIDTKADLSLVGGSKNAGMMHKNKNTVGESKLILVNQSVTGLFENRIEL